MPSSRVRSAMEVPSYPRRQNNCMARSRASSRSNSLGRPIVRMRFPPLCIDIRRRGNRYFYTDKYISSAVTRLFVENFMPRTILGCLAFFVAVVTALPAAAAIQPFPKDFNIQEVRVNGTTVHVRVGGTGPPVVLLHGFADTGDMWAPLAAVLAADHTVIVPDLRGMGLSAVPDHGFEKMNQAKDIADVLDVLHVEHADVVGHDIGNMVAFAFAERYPQRTSRLVMMDAPVPGVGPWDDILLSPLLWHFRFGGRDMERLVQGRERIYLDRFWNDFSANPSRFDEASRTHYAGLYAKPGRMHGGFAQFAAFDQDVIDNKAAIGLGRLQMPVLAVGGDHSLGSTMAYIMRYAADNVREVIIPDSGHWLMEEQPKATVAAIVVFLFVVLFLFFFCCCCRYAVCRSQWSP